MLSRRLPDRRCQVVDAVAKSKPDGYTIGLQTVSLAINPALFPTLPYDTLKDLRPVALMGMSEHVLAAHPGNGLKSVADIVAQAKAGRPLSYASFGQGTSAHLAGEMLKLALNTPNIVCPTRARRLRWRICWAARSA